MRAGEGTSNSRRISVAARAVEPGLVVAMRSIACLAASFMAGSLCKEARLRISRICSTVSAFPFIAARESGSNA